MNSLSAYFLPLPRLSPLSFNIIRRQWLVTKKLWKGGLAFIFLEPLFTLLGMGLGLGKLLPSVEGMSYLAFVTLGLMLFTPANIAVLETMYGGFSRLQHQRTWEGIMDTAMSLDDIVLGEIIWSTLRGTVNALMLWAVASLLGAFDSPLIVLPVVLLSALVAMMSACMGMILLGFARTYDVFTIFHTLVFIPATFLSGVFFPIQSLPEVLQRIANLLPFGSLIEFSRQFLLGNAEWSLLGQGLLTVVGYIVVSYVLAVGLIRRRLLGA